jgi:large subunit ribosomal protein L32
MHRNHQALRRVGLSKCPRCSTARKPHTICTECGFYRDRTVINLEAETEV